MSVPPIPSKPAGPPRWRLALLAVLVGTGSFLVALEINLRIQDPIPWRLRSQPLKLPANILFLVPHQELRGCDHRVEHLKNSLGFRGPEPPLLNPDPFLTLVAVGGSTTECFYLADEHAWPALIDADWRGKVRQYWINNAGYDGQSTFAHLLLLREALAPMRPKVVLYLIGINDVGLAAPNAADARLTQGFGRPSLRRRAARWLRAHVAVWQWAGRFWRETYLWPMPHSHQNLDFRALPRLSQAPSVRAKVLEEHRQKYLPGFEERVTALVRESRRAGIEPVLITQPAPFGPARDDQTGVDLGRIEAIQGLDGRGAWALLESYNDVTRSVARREGVLLIDLARRMPKSSLFYYDLCHFTKAGARRVADIVEEALGPFLTARFPNHFPAPAR